MTSVPASMNPQEPVAVFLVTGFLGSGKTSLIRRLMQSPELADTALIINEFGEVGLDQFFVQTPVENTLLLENGCVCCSIRGDLIDTIADLFARAGSGEIPSFSRIIVETTGLADPGPIAAALRQTAGTLRPIRLAKIIVTVDGLLGAQQIASTDEAPAQIAHADLCLVTKAELADPNAISELAEDLRSLNPAAAVDVLRGGPGDLRTVLAPPSAAAPPPVKSYRLKLRPQARSARHRSIESWSVETREPIAWDRFRDWFDLLYSLRAENLVRMKAVLNIAGQSKPFAIHGVGPLVGRPEPLDRWPEGLPMSRIVVITKNMSAEIVARSFAALVWPGQHPAAGQSAPGMA